MSQPIAVLDWQSWPGFLRYVLGDDAVRIDIDPFNPLPEQQFDLICKNHRIVCFQINFTLRRALALQTRVLTRRFLEQGLYVVNGLVQDIRKSALHKHLEALGLNSPKAASHGDPDESLFIKTDLNYGGAREKSIDIATQQNLGIQSLIADMDAYSYHMDHRGNLPPDVWTNPALVVERYIANPEDSFYRIYYSGKQVIIVKAFATGRIKKLDADPRDTNYVSELDYLRDGSDGLPISPRLKQTVVTFIEKTPLEFGCLDIVHDGQENYTIIDLNPTPSSDYGDPDADLSRFLKLGITEPSQRRNSTTIQSIQSPMF